MQVLHGDMISMLVCKDDEHVMSFRHKSSKDKIHEYTLEHGRWAIVSLGEFQAYKNFYRKYRKRPIQFSVVME